MVIVQPQGLCTFECVQTHKDPHSYCMGFGVGVVSYSSVLAHVFITALDAQLRSTDAVRCFPVSFCEPFIQCSPVLTSVNLLLIPDVQLVKRQLKKHRSGEKHEKLQQLLQRMVSGC